MTPPPPLPPVAAAAADSQVDQELARLVDAPELERARISFAVLPESSAFSSLIRQLTLRFFFSEKKKVKTKSKDLRIAGGKKTQAHFEEKHSRPRTICLLNRPCDHSSVFSISSRQLPREEKTGKERTGLLLRRKTGQLFSPHRRRHRNHCIFSFLLFLLISLACPRPPSASPRPLCLSAPSTR